MKYFLTISFSFLLLLSAFFSCKKDQQKQETIDMGYSYFPGEVGNYVIYDVDSFYYNDFTKHIDTFKFQIKEKIESIFQDNENRPTMRIEKYVRFYSPNIPYPSVPWKLRNVCISNLTASTAERVEENIRFTKLIFPVSTKSSWNGNLKNTLDPLNYSYLFVDLPRTIGQNQFDSVLQVNQQDATNLISKKYYIEKYARHIGLVQKQVIDVESQPDGVPDSLLPVWIATPIMDRVDKGFQYILTINSYGHE